MEIKDKTGGCKLIAAETKGSGGLYISQRSKKLYKRNVEVKLSRRTEGQTAAGRYK